MRSAGAAVPAFCSKDCEAGVGPCGGAALESDRKKSLRLLSRRARNGYAPWPGCNGREALDVRPRGTAANLLLKRRRRSRSGGVRSLKVTAKGRGCPAMAGGSGAGGASGGTGGRSLEKFLNHQTHRSGTSMGTRGETRSVPREGRGRCVPRVASYTPLVRAPGSVGKPSPASAGAGSAQDWFGARG